MSDPHAPFETSRLQAFSSGDGGSSWRETGFPWFGYDPWAALLPGGRALLAWLGGTDPTSGARPIRIFRGFDGTSWSPEVETIAGEFDGVKLAPFQGENARTGRAILAATRFDHGDDGMRSRVAVYRLAWEQVGSEAAAPPAVIDDGPSTRLTAQPVCLGDERVVVAAASPGSEAGEMAVWAHRSEDGGRTFLSRSLVSRKLSPGLGYAHLAGGTRRGRAGTDVLVFVRALALPHASGGVWLNRSIDHGRTWSQELRVDRFPDDASLGAQTASAAFSPDGTLGVSWVDGCGDPDARRRRLYFAWSTDGGETFAAPIPASDRSTDPLTTENAASGALLSGGGHYLGLAALPNGDFQALWSDSREGVFALYSARIRKSRGSTGKPIAR